ncbi:cupin domain-containing protein [Kamptonema cortianum]|nr:cupin domain-containing protein [Geitlerinema splendidum]MDK3160463.1 cupin domain-containing protein [Kamptonema cortianum]
MPGLKDTLCLPPDKAGGTLGISLHEFEPGSGPPPHIHHQEDEAFIVDEGEFEFWYEGKTTYLGKGGVGYVSRGCPHTIKNVGTENGKLWIIVNSPTFHEFLEKFFNLMSQPGEPDMRKVMALGNRYGIEFLPPAPQ